MTQDFSQTINILPAQNIIPFKKKFQTLICFRHKFFLNPNFFQTHIFPEQNFSFWHNTFYGPKNIFDPILTMIFFYLQTFWHFNSSLVKILPKLNTFDLLTINANCFLYTACVSYLLLLVGCLIKWVGCLI